MRPLRALLIYIAVVFIGGALLAPWLYDLAQHFSGSFPGVAKQPFHRFVNRSMYALALIGLWPLLKGLGATSLRDAGLVRPGGQWHKLGGGFLLGLSSLAVIAILALAAGARGFNDALPAAKIVQKILGAACTAVAVAVLEEILFRGGIFGGLRRVFDWRFASLLSSMVYAIVHFLAPTKDPATVTWSSGFQQLGLMLAGFTDFRQIVPGFFNLTLAGALLALACQRTGNLYYSIGLHAGWVFALKSYVAITKEVAGSNTWFWGGGRMVLVNGWIALPILLATVFVFTRLRLARKREVPL